MAAPAAVVDDVVVADGWGREREVVAVEAGGSGESTKVGTPLSVGWVAEALGVVCGEVSSSSSRSSVCVPFSSLLLLLSLSLSLSGLVIIGGGGGEGTAALSSATATATGAAPLSPPPPPPAPVFVGDGGGGEVGGCSILGWPRHKARRVSIRGGLLMAR